MDDATGMYTDDAEVENQADINDLAETARLLTGKSLKDRLAKLSLGWASPSRYVPNAAAVGLRDTGKRDEYGCPVYRRPEVPVVAQLGHHVADVFAPAQPGIGASDHMRVVREWIAEEELSEALHAGAAVDVVVKAARHMAARRVVRVLEQVGATMKESGGTLYIGPRDKLKAVDSGLVKAVKPEILEILNGQGQDAGPVCGVRAADGAAPLRAPETAPESPQSPPPGGRGHSAGGG